MAVNMNKDYDRVEWTFLAAVMNCMGFSSYWILRIMDFLHNTQFMLIINGSPSGTFRPTRGLRQGCPLSLYLFLLCSQGLSSLLKCQVSAGNLNGIRCARNASIITHLFFADDTDEIMDGSRVDQVANHVKDPLEMPRGPITRGCSNKFK
ncbi:uncharacterized protein [Henckelia pumila]|uniref:uncharacterized protein n=1 Tax=Henckelia pumila TaxID=405737 RepID=UPI003C6DEBF2